MYDINLIKTENRGMFKTMRIKIIFDKLRKKIYEHILEENENNFFDLQKFDKKHLKNLELTLVIVKDIITELEDAGWKCKLSYGNTALFIYSTEKPPPSCWEGEF
jgi:hypothetical protein